MIQLRSTVALVSMAIMTSGCATFRDYQSPIDETASTVTAFQEEPQTRFKADAPVITWWQSFNDPVLTNLIENAFKANPDIRIAYAGVIEARALSQEVGYRRGPTLDLNGNAARNLNSQETVSGENIPRTNSTFESGFDASWELDIFNRVSAQIAEQTALTEVAEADLHYMYVTIASEVARTYISLRGAEYRLDIAQRNQQNQAETFEFTKMLAKAGRASELDVSRAETQLTLTSALIPPLEAEITAALNRLAQLTGKMPNSLELTSETDKHLPEVPITISVGNAESLLRNRPDIRSAERALAASVANYNVAVSDLFPTVRILGSLGFVATSISSLGTSALSASLGPSLNWQVFNRGSIEARINQADARTIEALAHYDKTVLTAMQETQTALNSFSREEQRRNTLQYAAKTAQHSAVLAHQRFDQGYDDFLNVLDAERTLLETEDTLANSEIALLNQLISIYKSLGGGWQKADTRPVRAATEDS
jgi:multidrug efflux system outer membrane protein